MEPWAGSSSSPSVPHWGLPGSRVRGVLAGGLAPSVLPEKGPGWRGPGCRVFRLSLLCAENPRV